MHSFLLRGLDPAQFEPLFALDDEGLRAQHARRRIAGDQPGFPCRVSLRDVAPGEELLLLHHMHQPVDSPYRASGPIFVSRGAARAVLAPGEVPPYVTSRLVSLRAYDADHLIVDATVCEGRDAADEILRRFARVDVDYIHLHFARRGCFACRVDRA